MQRLFASQPSSRQAMVNIDSILQELASLSGCHLQPNTGANYIVHQVSARPHHTATQTPSPAACPARSGCLALPWPENPPLRSMCDACTSWFVTVSLVPSSSLRRMSPCVPIPALACMRHTHTAHTQYPTCSRTHPVRRHLPSTWPMCRTWPCGWLSSACSSWGDPLRTSPTAELKRGALALGGNNDETKEAANCPRPKQRRGSWMDYVATSQSVFLNVTSVCVGHQVTTHAAMYWTTGHIVQAT